MSQKQKPNLDAALANVSDSACRKVAPPTFGDLPLWQSHIQLGEAFFNEITARPIPLDMRILKEGAEEIEGKVYKYISILLNKQNRETDQ